ncbi:nucleolar MIF4G domain-containing protein 1 [Sorex fumeus]|uniref:nucleolar MIF4G domain-containing protein 1 n=1 Tax=Sorex fumeus TaxID=62283 RepID=UPI0024AE8008|nr:nucleolar MIF4G domain-containing protein 1 [Sorex fumeus]
MWHAHVHVVCLAWSEAISMSCPGHEEHRGGGAGARREARGRPRGRDRRALRREKRRLRKARRAGGAGGGAGTPGGAGGTEGAGSTGTPKSGRSAGSIASTGSTGTPGSTKTAPSGRTPGSAGSKKTPRSGGATPATPATRATPATAAARKRALLAANAEEEREIRRLERRLGLAKRRRRDAPQAVPPGFARDGLDYVLGVLGPGPGCGLYGDSEDEEEKGRQGGAHRALLDGGPEDSGDGGEDSDHEDSREDSGEDSGQEDSDHEDSGEDSGQEDSGEDSDHEDSGDGGEDSGQEDSDPEDSDHEDSKLDTGPGPGAQSQKLQKEPHGNPGEAPRPRPARRVRFADEDQGNSLEDGAPKDQTLSGNDEKYVPPAVRRAAERADAQKQEELDRLRKRVTGLVNRLSEPNVASISAQLEELYMAHSRRDVSATLTEALLRVCAPDTAAPSRLLLEHVLLVSVLHCTVGIEVGAHFLEAVVRRFDAAYRARTPGKECANLLSLVAHLYNFRVVHARLVFDVLRRLLDAFSEQDVELVLLVLRAAGFALRRDDALALKELIAEAQRKAGGADARLQEQSRVRFMLEAMLALKNNDVRKVPGYDPEPVERLRKLQRTLVRSTGSDTQLRVSWDNILHAEQTGRWWIVGSAWSGAPMIEDNARESPQKPQAGTVSAAMLELARKQRMNTDVRRSIFCTLMASEDFLDAFEKLLRLGLREQQLREVAHVLLDCCLQERTYNPFYALLAAKLCAHERRLQITFQFSLWDKFRDLENLPATNVSNLVQLVAHLLKTKSLPLSILKVVEFSELDKPRVHFLRKLLSMLLVDTEPEDLAAIFTRLSDNPKLGVLREGLKLFIGHFLLRPGRALPPQEAALLRERAELSTRALQGRAALRM